jgi:hypothetical protein
MSDTKPSAADRARALLARRETSVTKDALRAALGELLAELSEALSYFGVYVSDSEETAATARLQLEARERTIAELRAAVARHERANGRLVAELELARDVVRDLSAKVYASERLAMQEEVPTGVWRGQHGRRHRRPPHVQVQGRWYARQRTASVADG